MYLLITVCLKEFFNIIFLNEQLVVIIGTFFIQRLQSFIILFYWETEHLKILKWIPKKKILTKIHIKILKIFDSILDLRHLVIFCMILIDFHLHVCRETTIF
jgi:hypothetical protein